MKKKSSRKQLLSPFKAWIDEKGTEEISLKLGVDPSTVRHWRLGNCYPRVEQMRIIKKITKGEIGYEQIIDGTL